MHVLPKDPIILEFFLKICQIDKILSFRCRLWNNLDKCRGVTQILKRLQRDDVKTSEKKITFFFFSILLSLQK